MFAEEAVLGTMLKEPHLIADSGLKVENLQERENKAILETMLKLLANGHPVDMVTLLTQGNPEEFGGAGKLNRIQNLSNPLKFDGYVELVVQAWRNREKHRVLKIAEMEDWGIDKISSELDGLVSNKVNDHQSISDLVVEVAEDPWTKKDTLKGVPTGLEDLEKATHGWQNTDLIVIAARPSMGKTDAMLHFAEHAGWNNYLPIAFSLEMSGKKLRNRMIAAVGNYNRSKMKDVYTQLTEAQKASWQPTLAKVMKTNIQIFDKSGQTVAEMRMKIRKLVKQYPDKKPIIFIDYLTLIKPTDEHRGNAHQQTGEITKALKALAKEFDCPVVVLAQLSRRVEQREDKRPMMSDLRESGSIEEDADVVMFLYRDSYYSKKDEDKTLEMIIAKNREGETGTINTIYNKFTGVVT
ncbi:MAG: DnaB-like helicase C-terminal domain-containing protein [Planococcaceae bacterium]|nr:DnaB-like helicase C-terminal domain-containing protein [Planococcaceae bacterium]